MQVFTCSQGDPFRREIRWFTPVHTLQWLPVTVRIKSVSLHHSLVQLPPQLYVSPLVLLGTVLSKHSRHTHAPGPLHVPFPLPGMLLPPRFTLFMSLFYSSLYTSISPSGRPYLIALPTVLLPSLSISSPCSICVPSTSHYLALPLDDTHTHAVYTYANMCACTHTPPRCTLWIHLPH